jgi:aryl-alcohol dehydrogenase-like predicted oxidoreductase
MRYRQLGHSMAVSAVALTVDRRAGRRGADVLAGLLSAAMEAGVNAYHIECSDPEVLETVGRSLAAVERELLFVSLRLGLGRRAGHTSLTRDFSANALTGAIDQALARTGLGYLDLALLDRPREDELSVMALEALEQERTTGRVGLIGVAGAHDAVEAYLDAGAFDVLASPHHPRLGARELNRTKTAAGLGMGVIAYDYFPEIFREPSTTPGVPEKRGLLDGLSGAPKPHPLAGAGTFAFLHETSNWTAEELCLAYALTDPTVSTVLIRAYDLERLEALAAVPDRDLPPGAAAKVEMARFDMEQDGASSTIEDVKPLDCIVPYHEAFNIIDAFDALRSSVADSAGGFSGVVAPKVENIFKDYLPHLRGKTVVERSGRALQAVSPANLALHAPPPPSSLWAKIVKPRSAKSAETSNLRPIDAPPHQPAQAAQPSAAQPQMGAKTATATPPDPLSAESAESADTSHLPPIDVTPPQPPRTAQPSAAELRSWVKAVTPPDPPSGETDESDEAPDLAPIDVTPPDPPGAESDETLQFPPIEATLDEPTPDAEPSGDQPQMAIWRSKDYDYPVMPTGENFPGPDGRTYLKVDFNGSLTFVPADEMIYGEGAPPPRPPAEQPETGGGEGPAEAGDGEAPAESKLGERVMRVANGR